MNVSRAALAVLVLLLAARVHAHVDTIIPIASDGTMSRLPPQYQPAQLRISRDQRGVAAVALTLSGNTVEFPPCIARLFAVPRGQAIAGLASWYHKPRDPQERTLPPYIVVYLRQGTIGEPWSLERGHSIMFDLRSAEIAEIQRYRPSKDSTPERRMVERDVVEAASICNAGELRRLKLRPLFDEPRR